MGSTTHSTFVHRVISLALWERARVRATARSHGAMNQTRSFLASILGWHRAFAAPGDSHRRTFCHSLVSAVFSGNFAVDQSGLNLNNIEAAL